jgi:hypothetical protein
MPTRRQVLGAMATAPLWSLACSRRAETPLAHLHGEQWVHGVYEMHARRYLDVQMGSETSSHGAYRVLAQKGVTALHGLQAREVPFFMRVDTTSNTFRIQRTVPERLELTAAMTAADRQRATEDWQRAREHVHTDYFEINRLDWAMTTLLRQLMAIHSAMEQAEIEQFKIVRDLAEQRGGAATPYQLPQQVTREDYRDVLLLLLARLEDDRHRLAVIEASIAAVGLTARSTDAGSGSLAGNMHKVMLAVIRDAEATTPRPAQFPRQPASRAELLSLGQKLAAEIEVSAEYLSWKKNEETLALERIGVLFEAVDAITHFPTSALFQAVIAIWRGDDDYLTYLKALARIVPGGGEVASTVARGIETSERVRSVVQRAQRARSRPDAAGTGGAILEEANALLNTSTRFGRSRLDRQLAFLSTERELDELQTEVAATTLLRAPMPAVPGPGPGPK